MKTTFSRLGRFRTGLIASAVLALAGCGGGSDGSPAPAPVTPPVNAAPKAVLALAAESGTPTLGAEVALNGAGSSDPEAGALAYSWTLQSKPADSGAALAPGSAASNRFTPDRLGAYVVRLRVTDTAGAFSEQDFTVTVANHLPVAVIDRSALTVVAGAAVTASAALSYDEDGDALSYNWSFDSKPADSAAVIDKPGVADLSFMPDRAGTYTLLLKVGDGKQAVIKRLEIKVLAQNSGTVALPFAPLAARYSKALDKVVMVSSAPDALKIVDPFSGLIKTVLLPAAYKSMTLSADGKLAAVLHEGVLTLVDLATATVLHMSATGGAQTEVFLTDKGIAYLTGQTGGQWVTPAVTVLDARSGAMLPMSESGLGSGGYFYGTVKGIYSPLNHKGFTVSSGLSPVDISYFTVNPDSNAVLQLGDSPYHGDYDIGAPLFLSNKEDIVFTAVGTYFSTDTLRYVGRLALSGSLASLSQSNSLETLAIAVTTGGYPDYAATYPVSYKRYTGELMLYAGDLPLPAIGGLPSYGRGIFHSAGGSHVALVQTGSALQNAAALKFYLIYR
ncbi:MAG: Ig-like domain-containing protein [Pseudomonadota bacterium]